MTASKISHTHDRRLIVEGLDKHVVIQLLARHGACWGDERRLPDPRLPYVSTADGVDPAIEQAGLAVKQGYARLAVVLDADADAGARWQALSDRWTGAGLPAAGELPRGGWVHDLPDGRRFGAWVMPDNHLPGSLEAFLARLIPDGDPCWPWAAEAVEEARRRQAPLRDVDIDKARIHTWLAWREKPGKPPGTAILAGYFGHDTPLALQFVAWFRRVFDAPDTP